MLGPTRPLKLLLVGAGTTLALLAVALVAPANHLSSPSRPCAHLRQWPTSGVHWEQAKGQARLGFRRHHSHRRHLGKSKAGQRRGSSGPMNATVRPEVGEEMEVGRQVARSAALSSTRQSKFKRQAELDLAVNRLHILESLDAQLEQFVEKAAASNTANSPLPATFTAYPSAHSVRIETAHRGVAEPNQTCREQLCVLKLDWAFQFNSDQERAASGLKHEQPRSCLAEPELKRQIPPYMLNLYRQLRDSARTLTEASRLMPYQSMVMRSFRQPALSGLEAWPDLERGVVDGQLNSVRHVDSPSGEDKEEEEEDEKKRKVLLEDEDGEEEGRKTSWPANSSGWSSRRGQRGKLLSLAHQSHFFLLFCSFSFSFSASWQISSLCSTQLKCLQIIL